MARAAGRTIADARWNKNRLNHLGRLRKMHGASRAADILLSGKEAGHVIIADVYFEG